MQPPRRSTRRKVVSEPEKANPLPTGQRRSYSTKHNHPTTNDEQSRNLSRKIRNPGKKKTTPLTETLDDKSGYRSLINETYGLVVTDDFSALESCTVPNLDLAEESSDTPKTVEVPIFHKWLPEGRVCRRASQQELENLSDETFERRHRRHEKAEKAARNRERERFEHERWKQQVARDKLVHLTINRLLPVSPDKHHDNDDAEVRDVAQKETTTSPLHRSPSTPTSVSAQERLQRKARMSKRAKLRK